MNILDSQMDFVDSGPQRKWSDYQTAVFDAVRTGTQNILIQAVAGSGKTTTEVEAVKHAVGSAIFLAFNKAIAMDIAPRLDSGEAKTFNALGHKQWKENNWKAKLDKDKVYKLLQDYMGETARFYDYAYTLQRTISLAKNNALGIGEISQIADFSDIIESYFDVPSEEIEDLAGIARNVFEMSAAMTETFDFDDQLYLPVRFEWDYPRYDNVFVDECQDLSPIQHLMLQRMASTARIVAVGDRHQAIYGFRGAMTDSMDALKGQFSMLELPLSISYRCARNIVYEAQTICPSIQSREDAPEGRVWTKDTDPSLFRDSMIVCRNNYPLFKAILRHVRARQPCQVLSNFLDSFQGFVRGFKSKTTLELMARLDTWYEKEMKAAEEKGFRGKMAAIADKYETVKVLSKDYQLVEDVISMVKGLQYGKTGPIFATIHKAKGLEHENVYLLRPDMLPAFYATTEDQIKQEYNLKYVAITRAKLSFTYGAEI